MAGAWVGCLYGGVVRRRVRLGIRPPWRGAGGPRRGCSARRFFHDAGGDGHAGAAGRRAGGHRLARVRAQQRGAALLRSEEHTSELQSLMRISYSVFCLKKKIIDATRHSNETPYVIYSQIDSVLITRTRLYSI